MRWIAFEPTAWLVHVASGKDVQRRDEALEALHERAAGGEMSAGQWNSIIDAGINYESDPTRTWDGMWGALLGDAYARNAFDDGRRTRYLDGLIAQSNRPEATRASMALDELTTNMTRGLPTPAQWDRVTAAAR